jgi:hypothetical protein
MVVIPAEAGIQCFRILRRKAWIPACAGMTDQEREVVSSNSSVRR